MSRDDFFRALDAKLDRGAIEHGEESFERSAPDLLGELEAEALDLAGWGYILWARLRRLRGQAAAVELAADVPTLAKGEARGLRAAARMLRAGARRSMAESGAAGPVIANLLADYALLVEAEAERRG